MSFQRTWAASRKTKAATGFRSSLEEALAKALQSADIHYYYETVRVPYTSPSFYLPDFILEDQAIIIETKGAFLPSDRAKMLRVKAIHPDLDIRFLFSNPNTRLGKQSKTTYGMWCNRHGFPFAKGGTPPQTWLDNKPTDAAREALQRILHAA